MMIPIISNTGGQPVIFVPLSIILLVNILKNVAEDLKRRSSDNSENNGKVSDH